MRIEDLRYSVQILRSNIFNLLLDIDENLIFLLRIGFVASKDSDTVVFICEGFTINPYRKYDFEVRLVIIILLYLRILNP
jgi:hypothetical protein